MSTRGLYGVRLNGVDKCTYNHSGSYPSWLGRKIVEFCANNTLEKLQKFHDNTILVSGNSKPTEEQIARCIKAGYYSRYVSSKSVEDWYCLLRNLQQNFDCYQECIDNDQEIFMIDGTNFIKDSLYCEYAYIINLDDETLEYYEGYQKVPQNENRYGIRPDEDGYYPCKLMLAFQLDELDDIDSIINIMEIGSYEIAKTMELYSSYDLTEEEAKEIDDKKILAIWDCIEDAAREEAFSFGFLNDENERYFNLNLYGQDLLESDGYIELESGRVIFYEY